MRDRRTPNMKRAIRNASLAAIGSLAFSCEIRNSVPATRNGGVVAIGSSAGGASRQREFTTDERRGLRLVYHETFDAPFDTKEPWVEDTYSPTSPYYADAAFGDNGGFFRERGGTAFITGLAQFRSFRRSIVYGKDGWLTLELYGRDSNKDGIPETGGQFVAVEGKAKLITTRHYDAAILRSTRPLPSRYRVEVTVSNIQFGGKQKGSWTYGGKTNGHFGGETADPWRFTDSSLTPESATSDNGVYFLCITDYAAPAPHNNVFIHHHRKVVMDTNNNMQEWSSVWDPSTRKAVVDGSHYISMIWLNGEDWGKDWYGNKFTSWTPGGWQTSPVFADKYIPGEAYVFAIERGLDSYSMSVSGRFVHGGVRTYAAKRGFRETPVTWHYNQEPGEYLPARFNQTKTFDGVTFDTWPDGSAYPDYFFFGDPHINYYQGTAQYDDLKLYIPH